MRKILLTPGPCMTSETVRQAGALKDLNHRDPEFIQLIHETRLKLVGLYEGTRDGWTPYVLGGSGTLAVEAMITSCVVHGPVLLLENGYYSGRVADILDAHNIPYKALKLDWLSPWDFEKITAELRRGYEAVVGTHNETTTGRLNDIGRLATICREYESTCLIDAMSSFGAESIDFENLDAVCASANKCLHGVPGVGFVLVSNRLFDRIDPVPRRSFYMSLPMYGGDNPPLTPPVPAVSSFRQALREFPDGGVGARHASYVEKIEVVDAGLAARGFVGAIPTSESSCTLRTVSLPAGWTYDRWFEANLERGFVLYGCKGDLHDRFYQVSVMGEVTVQDVKAWLAAVDDILG